MADYLLKVTVMQVSIEMMDLIVLFNGFAAEIELFRLNKNLQLFYIKYRFYHMKKYLITRKPKLILALGLILLKEI